MNDIQKEWVAALRSGEYRQTTGMLHKKDSSGDSYCCLGVLCELAIKHGVEVPVETVLLLEGDDNKVAKSYDGCSGSLPDVVRDWANLKTNDGVYSRTPGDYLAWQNDNGRTFEEIASLIEEHEANLFTA